MTVKAWLGLGAAGVIVAIAGHVFSAAAPGHDPLAVASSVAVDASRGPLSLYVGAAAGVVATWCWSAFRGIPWMSVPGRVAGWVKARGVSGGWASAAAISIAVIAFY